MQALARLGAVLTLLVLVVGTPVAAQDHVLSEDELRSAVVEEGGEDEAAQRALIQRVLERDEVEKVARRAGFDVERAREAVAQIEGGELARLAALARDVEDQLAGGQARITITTSAIIIALLVIIIILVA